MLYLIVLLPMIGSVFPVVFRRASSTTVAWSAALPVIASLGMLAAQAPAVLAGTVVRSDWPWLPAAGLTLALRVDGLSWLFGMMVLVIGLFVQLYARYYMQGDRELGRLYVLLSLFMGSMLGLVLSGNLLLLVVFWEATSLVSFLLIGFKTADPAARAGARTALAVTAGGGLALLAGVLLLGRIVGSYDLDRVLAAGDLVRAHAWYLPTLVLVLLGAFTKSAQFPFHFWLPRAMSAPTPVSAYLHSATMVKAGVFLLARLYPTLSGTSEWTGIVGTVGMLTLLVGAYSAMWQHDLKGLLAYSTISHLGLITLLLGFSSPMAVVAAVFHVVNHATFKASLFMAAGMIDHEVGTRDMRVLNGLWRQMPWTGALAIIAASAMAGVPLLNGFLSKEMFFAEALTSQTLSLRWIEPLAAVVAGALGVGYSLRFIMEVFFNADNTPLPKIPHEPPMFMRLPGGVLAIACLAVGIAPSLLMARQLLPAVDAVLQAPAPTFDLAIWHGVNLPLVMSVIALLGGIALYRVRESAYAWHDRLPTVDGLHIFDAMFSAFTRTAVHATQALENGSLQRYVRWLLIATLIAGVAPWIQSASMATAWSTMRDAGFAWPAAIPDAASTALCALLVACTLWTVMSRHAPLTAVVAISTVGLLVSLAFARLAAPDLALTQLLVELVTILLLLVAVRHLTPASVTREARTGEARTGEARTGEARTGEARTGEARTPRVRDALIASAIGGTSGLLAWVLLERPSVPSVSDFYALASVPQGHGRNMVNVILVDFRGFDTLGEVAVLTMAALGVLIALDQGRPLLRGVSLPAHGPEDIDPFAERVPVMLRMIARALLPLAAMMTVFVLLRGHDLPGGGFAAGMLTAVMLVVQALAGQPGVLHPVGFDLRRLMMIGLLIALATGAASVLFGLPFLTSGYRSIALPVIGSIALPSAIAFDFGVYLAVVGATVVIVNRLGRYEAAAARDAQERSP